MEKTIELPAGTPIELLTYALSGVIGFTNPETAGEESVGIADALIENILNGDTETRAEAQDSLRDILVGANAVSSIIEAMTPFAEQETNDEPAFTAPDGGVTSTGFSFDRATGSLSIPGLTLTSANATIGEGVRDAATPTEPSLDDLKQAIAAGLGVPLDKIVFLGADQLGAPSSVYNLFEGVAGLNRAA